MKKAIDSFKQRKEKIINAEKEAPGINRHQLKETLTNLKDLVTNINQKLDGLSKTF